MLSPLRSDDGIMLLSPMITACDDLSSSVNLTEFGLPPWQQELSVYARDSTSGDDERSFTISPLPIAVESAADSPDRDVTTAAAVSGAVQQSVRRMRQRLWDSDRRRRESAVLQQLQSLSKTQRSTNNASRNSTTGNSRQMKRRVDKLSVLESAAATIRQMQRNISELQAQLAADATTSSAAVSSSDSVLSTTKVVRRHKRLREDTSSSADTSSDSVSAASTATTVTYNQLFFSAFAFSPIKQFLSNADTGRVLAVNHAFSAETGFLAADVVGLQFGPSRGEYLNNRAEDVDDDRFNGQLIRRFGVVAPFNRPRHSLEFKRKMKALYEETIEYVDAIFHIDCNGYTKTIRRIIWTSKVEVPADSQHERSFVVLLHNVGHTC